MLINFYVKLLKISRVQQFSSQVMSSIKCHVAVCQFTATNNKENNLKTVKRLVSRAAEQRAKVVFLPEGCDYIATNQEETRALAEPLTGPLMTEYRTLAETHKVWLSIGGFHELSDDQNKLFNCHVLIDDSGEIRGTYKKIHLFDVTLPEKNVYLRESDSIKQGGDVVPPFNTPAGLVALSICYDLRFPELSLLQRKQGAAILTYPSAFTNATGIWHWETLLRARAIENQCYVIAAAQYGQHNEKRTSYGQSLIVDPWGKILAECAKYDPEIATDESLAIAEIDSRVIEKVREEMPVFQHRRSDIYELKLLNNKKYQINDFENFMFADKVIPGFTVFYRSRHSFGFTNIRCVVPGHVLISSLRRARRMADLSEEEVADLFQTAVRVQKVIEEVMSASSSTICVQDGKNAGQTIPHVHVHIMPRKENDFSRNDDIYDKLAQHDRSNNPDPVRSLTEMSEEAKLLRQYF